MRAKFLLACLMVMLTGQTLLAQFTGDVIGMHDLGPGSKSPITGARPDFCMYCHEPHSGLGGRLPLWNQKLTVQSYSLYTSDTEKNRGTQPLLGADSNLCLSCHDGTVAPGTTVVYRPSHHAGIDVHLRYIWQQSAAVAPFRFGSAHKRQY